MISKIIFVLATVYVIDASVLTVNVFDDDPGTELASNPGNCNFRACDQLCRRLKFPGGACFNGRCKCDNFLNAEDGVSEKSLSNVENSVSQQDDLEAEVAASPSRCNLKLCDLVCHWLNKKSGSCVDGRCKCAKSLVGEDDPETEIENKKSDCNNQACVQLCRRLKFTGGACVNGRCKCDNFLNAEDDMTDPAEFLSPSSCNFRACDQQCFRFGYPGGACVNGRCKCRKFLNAEDTMTEPAESLPLSSCNSIACDDKCRRTGWHSGVCIKGQCKCDYFLNSEVAENSLSNLEDSVSPRKCTHQECNALCRRLKFREGVCIAGRCSCNNYFPNPKDTMNDSEESISLDNNVLRTEDVVSDESLPVSELPEDQTERGCNMRACDQLCRKLKFPGGACVNGRCKCDNFYGTEDAVDEYSEFASRRICMLPKCNRTCTRRGYEIAKCVNGRCKCYNKTQTEDDISETSLPVSELSEDQTERGCNMRACDQSCRRLKFPGGACVNGRCKCDNFFGTGVDAVDEYSESATRRICQLRQCNRTCSRRGYESARCVNGWCKCYNKIQRQDASPLSDVTSDENEESNVIGTNEIPSPRACNAVKCNQNCRRLKYTGGWCSQDQCRCY